MQLIYPLEQKFRYMKQTYVFSLRCKAGMEHTIKIGAHTRDRTAIPVFERATSETGI
jgi:hypothetical protein